jgi:hypothetical protein
MTQPWLRHLFCLRAASARPESPRIPLVSKSFGVPAEALIGAAEIFISKLHCNTPHPPLKAQFSRWRPAAMRLR